MRNIGNDAILFDMFYFAKVKLIGTKIEIPPVDAGTPQFRKFYISNVVCEGADRAMLIRGLPEMSIKDIQLSDVVIKSRRGVEVVEASGVGFSNVVLQCALSSPLINIENSHHLTFSKIQALTAPKQFYSMNGERSRDIQVDSVNAGGVMFGYGADEKAVTVGR